VPLIQNPSPTRKLQRGLRLTHLPDGVLAPEIVGVILLEDYSKPLGDLERGCLGSVSQAAVPAEASVSTLVRVGNPATYDMVVHGVSINTVADATVLVRYPSQGLVGIVVTTDTQFTDRDLPGRPASQLGSFTGAVAISAATIWRGTILANTPTWVPIEGRLGPVPGDRNSVIVQMAANNLLLNCSWAWTESEPQG